MLGHLRPRVTRRLVGPLLVASMGMVVVAAAAAAAFETDTVTSYWQGLFWAISLITTVGFVGQPPRTDPGTLLAVALMVVGFVLLSMVSAYLASMFVRENEEPHDEAEESTGREILATLRRLEDRITSLEGAISAKPTHESPGGPAGSSDARERAAE